MKTIVLDRIRSEYREMPGLRLSAKQVARLCGIGDAICYASLDVLVQEGFLRVTSGGMYIHARHDLHTWSRHVQRTA
jgi:hypothetical protein